MSSLIPFSFENQSIRVVTTDDGEPLFVAKDVATVLGYSNTADAVRKHCKHAKSLIELGCAFHAPQQNQALTLDPQTKLIPESDLYRLTLKSQLDSAELFQDWVVEEVLPTIRKTGKYEAPVTKSASQADIKPRAIKEAFSLGLYLAKQCGFKENQALLSADRCAREFTGCSALDLIGATHLIADIRGRTYTPTDMGKMAIPPISGQKMNKLLEEHGMQIKGIKGEWVPLDKADGLYEWTDTGKRHSDGAPVKQLRWFIEVLDNMGVDYEIKESAA